MGDLSELSKLLQGKVLVSADITEADISSSGIDLYQLAALIENYFENVKGIRLLNKDLIKKVVAQVETAKKPAEIENAFTKEEKIGAKASTPFRFSVRNTAIDYVSSSTGDFIMHFNDRFEKLKRILMSSRSVSAIDIGNLSSYMSGREVGVIGMVYEKRTTKNGHVLVTLEDPTGTINVLFARPEKKQQPGFKNNNNEALYANANKILNDDVIAVSGKLSKGLLIANSLSWPDVPIRMRRQSEEDFAIAFISDTHVGHKLFLEKQFTKMLQWLNGGIDYKRDLAKKVKYVVIAGDVADGIGVYPDQEKELILTDIYKQYDLFFEFLKGIPDTIEAFVLPGNHDAVRRAEPQPTLESLAKEYSDSNVHLVTNPVMLNLEDIKVLAYHGASLDSVIAGVPGCTYAAPEDAMVEILKRRHLSPVYGENVIMPSRSDNLVIEEVPDILIMGHIHKNGAIDYHGTLVLNSGTWQARTAFQIKQGHIPTPALLPVYEAKTRTLSAIDFNTIVG